MTDSQTLTSAHEQPSQAREPKKPLPVWAETVVLLVVALLLAIAVKSFFVQAFYIPSESMEPLFIKNDRILVQKVSYWGGGGPQRGDVVVFADPGNWLDSAESGAPGNPVTKALATIGLSPSGGHLVKRVIGTGGDRVTCSKDDRLAVNGRVLDEPYLQKGAQHCLGGTGTTFDVRVPEGDLWVMGDNRDDSCDSRCHLGQPGGGFVPAHLVVGKAWALVWPWKRIDRIDSPSAFADVPAPS